MLSTEARVALTLRLLGGLTTEEIARALLVPEATVAQRVVRAKRTLSAARVPFEVPRGEALRARLGSVLEVIYLVFNEGYAATRGAHWTRPALCEDALRLGRILATRVPDDPEVHGLLALMELQASRLHARCDRAGNPVLLLEQDRARWDPLLIQRGLGALARSTALGRPLGPYALQAALAACHARARERAARAVAVCSERSASSATINSATARCAGGNSWVSMSASAAAHSCARPSRSSRRTAIKRACCALA